MTTTETIQNSYWMDHLIPAKGKEFYDLGKDPGESKNIYSNGGKELEVLGIRLNGYINTQSKKELRSVKPDPESDAHLKEIMKSLGY